MKFSVAVLLGLLSTGCVTRSTVTTHQVPSTPSADNAFDRMLNPDNGLLLHKWIVSDNPDRIGDALSRYADGQVLDTKKDESLRRNGLRLERVRAEQTNDLLGDLGVGPSDVAAWHGQVVDWRELYRRPVSGPGATLAVSGRVRSIPAGEVRLMGRSWTVLMEDGPYLTLELLPQLRRQQDPSLYRLLGDGDRDGEILEALAIEVELESGYVYVLTGERPAVEWTDVPGDPAGPNVETPDTLGEFLFSQRTEPKVRTLLVFVPRISDRLLRPYRTEGTTPEGHPVAATR
jgi:hypothetical protein